MENTIGITLKTGVGVQSAILHVCQWLTHLVFSAIFYFTLPNCDFACLRYLLGNFEHESLKCQRVNSKLNSIASGRQVASLERPTHIFDVAGGSTINVSKDCKSVFGVVVEKITMFSCVE